MDAGQILELAFRQTLTLLGGATVVLAALFGVLWFLLRQRLEHQNKELLARLDAQLQRTVFVDKLQFEHEYAIYKQAWEALVALRRATMTLRPVLDIFDASESEEDRMKRRMNDFAAPFNTYVSIVEKNKPFYAQSVYDALFDVLDKCHGERVDYEYTERKKKEYYEEARKNQVAITESIDRACEAIRSRVREVRVT